MSEADDRIRRQQNYVSEADDRIRRQQKLCVRGRHLIRRQQNYVSEANDHIRRQQNYVSEAKRSHPPSSEADISPSAKLCVRGERSHSPSENSSEKTMCQRTIA